MQGPGHAGVSRDPGSPGRSRREGPRGSRGSKKSAPAATQQHPGFCAGGSSTTNGSGYQSSPARELSQGSADNQTITVLINPNMTCTALLKGVTGLVRTSLDLQVEGAMIPKQFGSLAPHGWYLGEARSSCRGLDNYIHHGTTTITIAIVSFIYLKNWYRILKKSY